MKKVALVLMVYFVLHQTKNFRNESSFEVQNKDFLIRRQNNNNKRRFCAPINLYTNHSATFQLIISGDIETNPGPIACPVCTKTVRTNSYRLECKVCHHTTHVKCMYRTVKNFVNKLNQWTCHDCLLAELPFFEVRDLTENQVAVHDNREEDEHHQALNENRNRISICHLNTQSITSTFAAFERMLWSYQFDIITLSETWLKDNPQLLKHVSIPGYVPKFHHRDKKRGGGVGMYIRESIKFKKRDDITDKDNTIEHMWMEIKGKHDSFLLAAMYQPSPALADKRIWLTKLDALLAYVSTIWTGPIIITGDTNIDLLENSEIAHEYKELLANHHLKQHITKPTRHGRTLIDHIASNLPKINHENILPCDEISDHDGPYVVFDVKKPRFEPRFKHIRIEKNFNPTSFVSDVEKLPFAAVYGLETSEDKLHCFNKLFLSCLNEHAPLVKCKITRPPAPWLCELKLSAKLYEQKQLRTRAHERPHNEQAWTAFRKIRNEVKKDIRTAKANFYKKALSSKRPKEVWNTIHRILNPSQKSIDADPDVLNEHYNTTAVRLLNSAPKSEETLRNFIDTLPDNPNTFSFSKTTYSDTRKSILSLRNDCSTGQDKLPAKFLKLCVNEITSPICHIINTAIEENSFPNQ